jgi:putative ABC transport system permease protein
MQELRQTLRSLWRDKGFTAVAIAMLALGIGATTAIFSVVNSILLKPLPYPDPDRLYLVNEADQELADEYPVLPVNARHVDDWRRACEACESFGLFQARGGPLAGDGPPEFLEILRVSHDFLPTLGVAPVLGRGLLPEDDQPGAAPVILLSDALWKRRFGGDPGAIGSTIAIGGESAEIVGVLPPTFRFRIGSIAGAIAPMPPSFDALRPLRTAYSEIRPAGNFNWGAIARLKEQASPEVAVQQMNAAIVAYNQEFSRRTFGKLTPLAEHITAESAPGLWLLLGAVGAVMLIVCVNLSSLLLARAQRREREAAVRRALGAGSSRLFGWALREGLVLGLLGGALGLALAQWAVRALVLLAPADTPRLDEIAVDWTALAMSASVAIGAGLVAALIPAMRLAAAPIQHAMRQSQAASSQSASRVRGQNALVVSEVALSSALLVVSALLMTSLFRLMAVDKGFEQEGVLSFEASIAGTFDERRQFHESVLRELRSKPGVVSAALTTWLPLEGPKWIDSVATPGEQRQEDDSHRANFRWVSADYWKTMGMRLVEGEFPRDGEPAARVVVSRGLSRMLWSNESGVGKLVRRGNSDPMEVAAVVDEVLTSGLASDPVPIVYIPFETFAPGDVTYVVRTAGDPAGFTPQAREAVAAVNSGVPLRSIRTIRQLVDDSAAQERFQTTLAGIFAVIALLLAALGVFGVVSYGVSRRTNEMGVRLALGASPPSVRGLILRQSLRPVVAGLLCGLLAAAWIGRLVAGLLFNVKAFDPGLYAVVAAVVLAVSAAACLLPAWRAACVDPIQALRYE